MNSIRIVVLPDVGHRQADAMRLVAAYLYGLTNANIPVSESAACAAKRDVEWGWVGFGEGVGGYG